MQFQHEPKKTATCRTGPVRYKAAGDSPEHLFSDKPLPLPVVWGPMRASPKSRQLARRAVAVGPGAEDEKGSIFYLLCLLPRPPHTKREQGSSSDDCSNLRECVAVGPCRARSLFVVLVKELLRPRVMKVEGAVRRAFLGRALYVTITALGSASRA